ncbi:GDP-mannose 4,6-dehydratase [Lysobacter humi (ex Lee et al. 2017)]
MKTTETYLITGGAGFIGSHLCDELLDAGHRVLVIDDLSTGSLENIAAHQANPRFEFHRGCVSDPVLMRRLMERVDYVFHLAAVVGVQRVVESAIRTIETGAHGMGVVLTLADQLKKPVLFTSTSEVYGKSEKLPFHEDDDLVFGATHVGRWSYACAKALDEFHALAYHREHGLKIVIVRLFNTVGPRQSGKYGMVVPRFVSAALEGQPLTVYGDGSHRRCFGYVKDVTWALRRLVKREDCYGRVFNVGSNEPVSVLQLARRVKAQLASDSEIRFASYESVFGPDFEETVDRAPDCSRVREAIGFAPTTTLEEIIDAVADFHAAHVA